MWTTCKIKQKKLVLCLQAAVRLLTVSVRLHHIVSAGVHFSLGLKKINNMLNLRIKNEIQYRAWLSPDSVDHVTTEATCPHRRSSVTLSRFACSGCDYRTRKHVRGGQRVTTGMLTTRNCCCRSRLFLPPRGQWLAQSEYVKMTGAFQGGCTRI